MLLLVLILVLIAFSLLVVALLSGSVLWAWVSVAVSVAAAVVLLIDYLQRRSAVRAGAEAGTVATPPGSTLPEAEPVTEVLPVIPRSGAAAGGDEDAGSDQKDQSTALFDQEADSQQTIVMPVVQPPASTDRPSGASSGTTPSSGDSSPTVTEAGSGRATSGSQPGDTGDAPAASEGASGTAAADTAEETADEKPAADAGADATAVVDAKGSRPESSASAQEKAAADGPATGTDGTSSAAEAADSVGAEGEPPEESRDPAAAAVVAGLEAEVLVIDEQPRYHVPGCRSLEGKPLIPLPAREAVDLGFTPCGWCNPDRTLAAQHAGAR